MECNSPLSKRTQSKGPTFYNIVGVIETQWLKTQETYCLAVIFLRNVEIPKGKYNGQLPTKLVAIKTTDKATSKIPNVPGIDPEK